MASVTPVFCGVVGRPCRTENHIHETLQRTCVFVLSRCRGVPRIRLFFAIYLALLLPVRQLAYAEILHAQVLLYNPFSQRAPGLAGFGHDRCICLARVGKVEAGYNRPCFVVEVWSPGN